MPKIKKSFIPELGRIHKKFSLPEDHVRFSFKYLDMNDKFHVRDSGIKYLETLFDRLKSISGITVQKFREGGKSLRSHRIHWEKTSEKKGFKGLNMQLNQCEPWQFQLTSNEHGRVHGILLDEIFYIIWLDPYHKLYC